jgi:uncharacterized protein YjbJ (UPF0337 family)
LAELHNSVNLLYNKRNEPLRISLGVNHVSLMENCITSCNEDEPTFALWKLIHDLIINAMNTIEMKGNWNEQKGKLKQKFAMLTDNDLMFAKGKKEEMYGRLQTKLGKTKEELLSIIEAL